MSYREEVELVPRNGHILIVLIVARISGCANQKELSLEDQVDHAKEVAQEYYGGEIDFRIISTKGKGERLDRPELLDIEERLEANEFDLMIFEDIGRLVRGAAAHTMCGTAVDNGTRVISPNDDFDTNDSDWESKVMDACKEHMKHNEHTSRRIKQKKMNRFKKYGAATPCPIAGYIKPDGAETFSDWSKDADAAEYIKEGLQTLRRTLNGEAVAEYFNEVGFSPGPYCRKKQWDGKMVLRFYRNPILKGLPARGTMHTTKKHKTGRRTSTRNPVNPPLVKCLAAQSIALAKPQMYWDTTIIKNKPEYRPEFSLGARFVRLNRTRIRLLFFNARLSCLLFSVIGGLVCWKWSRDLYGPSAGLFALALWSFSPNVLAWSATICPDAAAAALGVSAAYCFWRWLINPDSLGAMIAGIVLGLAQLTKMTLIIFFLLWPVVWITYRFSQAHENSDTNKKPSLPELSAILVVALFVLNLGYGFEGTFTRLSEFSFVSSTLTGEGSFTEGGGNRFRETWLENCPVPIPSNYLRGMDLQRHDFEKGLSSYLLGQWQDKGWWYYYIIASLLKVPLGILVLTLISFLLSLKFSNKTCLKSVSGDSNRPIWIHETVLLIPMISLFILVSSQDGFSRHFRYVIYVN